LNNPQIAQGLVHESLEARFPSVEGQLPQNLGLDGRAFEQLGSCLLYTSPQFTAKQPPPEHVFEPRYTYNPQAKGRVIIFHDSFGLRWIRFLGYHFNQVTYLWQYYLNPAWIEREKPDLVVSEMNERFFNIAQPEELMAKEALN